MYNILSEYLVRYIMFVWYVFGFNQSGFDRVFRLYIFLVGIYSICIKLYKYNVCNYCKQIIQSWTPGGGARRGICPPLEFK